ncbi:putative inner membrane domain protein, partial [Chlamydia psittaci 08-2626_L3]
MIILNT